MRPRDKKFSPGDYVLATKYSDGDPGDGFAIGFYHSCYDHFGQTRHLVVDSEGKQFKANGFRRVESISAERGKYLVENVRNIEISSYSVWYWKYRKIV